MEIYYDAFITCSTCTADPRIFVHPEKWFCVTLVDRFQWRQFLQWKLSDNKTKIFFHISEYWYHSGFCGFCHKKMHRFSKSCRCRFFLPSLSTLYVSTRVSPSVKKFFCYSKTIPVYFFLFNKSKEGRAIRILVSYHYQIWQATCFL